MKQAGTARSRSIHAAASQLGRALLPVVLAVIAHPPPTPAEERPRSEPAGGPNADRPGFSFSATAVERGVVQLEAGYQLTMNDGTDLHQIPTTALRIGVAEGIELRADWGGYAWQDGTEHLDGATDVSVGTKGTLIETETTSLGLLFLLSLPLGAEAFGSDDFGPTLALPVSQLLPGGVTLFGTLLASYPTESGGSRRWLGTPAFGLSLPLSDRVSIFVEEFSVVTEDAPTTHTIDFGLTFTPRSNVQLDLNGGVGLNGAADDGFVSGGIVWSW